MNKDKNNKLKNILYGVCIFLGIILTVIVMIANLNSNKKDDKILSYTDLIKQISVGNVKKVEMTSGSTSIKITLNKKINENGEIIEEDVKGKSNEPENITDDRREIGILNITVQYDVRGLERTITTTAKTIVYQSN